MKISLVLCCAVLLLSCVSPPSAPESLSSRAPTVLAIAPGAGARISTEPRLALFFSQPVDEETLGDKSILLVEGEVDEYAFQKTSDLYKAIDKGSLSSVSMERLLRNDHKTLLLSAQELLNGSTVYSLIITSRILSEDHIPLQGGEGKKFVLTTFQTVSDDTEVGEDTLPEIETLFDAVEAENGSPDSPMEESAPADPPVEEVSLEIIGRVVINEIYYDAVGSDTDGLLFVELYGEPGLLIGNVKIAFVDGGDGSVDDTIALPEDARLGADGFYVIADARTGMATVTTVPGADLIDNFDPSNGPDAIQLIDMDGNLVDAVAYGEGGVSAAENGLATGEGSPAPDIVSGHSLERREPGMDTGDNYNDFIEREVPTPGL